MAGPDPRDYDPITGRWRTLELDREHRPDRYANEGKQAAEQRQRPRGAIAQLVSDLTDHADRMNAQAVRVSQLALRLTGPPRAAAECEQTEGEANTIERPDDAMHALAWATNEIAKAVERLSQQLDRLDEL